MDKIFSAYDSAKRKAIQGDFIDKLHSQYTVGLLLVIIFLVVSKQYDGSAIACWLPTNFNGAQEEYVHQFCWINNTYSYPFEEDAENFAQSDKYVIRYYQYILFILSGQVLLFYLPSFLWEAMASDSATYVNKILEQCKRDKVFHSQIKSFSKEIDKKEKETRESNDMSQSVTESHSLLVSSTYIENFKSNFERLKHHNIKSNQKKLNDDNSELMTQRGTKSKFQGLKKKIFDTIRPIKGVKNLALFYFIFKFLNLINVFAQIVCLWFIFGNDFYKYGFDFIDRLYNNEYPMFLSKQFPIMALCDYYIHQNLGKIHWNSSQCLLAINILIEKFFVIIWFWLYILFVVTIINIFSWFIEILPFHKNNFLMKYLSIKEKMLSKRIHLENNPTTPLNLQEVDNFQKKSLGNDGVIMMHMIKSVAGDLIFIELLNEIWLDHLKRTQSLERRESKSKISELE